MAALQDNVETVCWLASGVWMVASLLRMTYEQWRALRTPDEPRCAGCGQIIVKDWSKICPECGGDLRVVGLVTPDSPPQLKFLDCVIVLGLLLTPMAVTGGEVLARHQPFGWYYQANVYLDPADFDLNPEQCGNGFTVQAFGYGRYFAKRPNVIRVFLTQANVRGRYVGMTVTPTGWMVENWLPYSRCKYDLTALQSTFGVALQKVPPEVEQRMLSHLDSSIERLSRGEFPSENEWDSQSRDRVLYTAEPNVRLFSAIVCTTATWLAVYGVVRLGFHLAARYRGSHWLRERRANTLRSQVIKY